MAAKDMAANLTAANIIELGDLRARLGRLDRLLGLDLGTKTIGIAVSDVERRLASPVTTVRRTRFTADAAAVVAQAGTLGARAFVIGLPLNMDGSAGPRVQSTHAFIRNMAPLTPLPFVLWDERLSTAAVTRSLIEQDVSRAKRAAVVDRLAAAYILQGALDRLARMGGEALQP
jgi:putative holliday junction resolvase